MPIGIRLKKDAAEATATAITDSSGGTASATIAATAGVTQLVFPVLNVNIADGDIVSTFTPGYKFKLLSFDYVVGEPVTTASDLSTLNIEIGTTNVTGGAISLTSAACTPLGAVVAGSAITAANTGSASDTISIEAASTTAFAEGDGSMVITIQNMDTADALASVLAKNVNLLADVESLRRVVNDRPAS